MSILFIRSFDQLQHYCEHLHSGHHGGVSGDLGQGGLEGGGQAQILERGGDIHHQGELKGGRNFIRHCTLATTFLITIRYFSPINFLLCFKACFFLLIILLGHHDLLTSDPHIPGGAISTRGQQSDGGAGDDQAHGQGPHV